MDITECKDIFFLGIGGVSMSSLALIMKKRGVHVAGYDAVKSSETEMLERHGIDICYAIDEISLAGFGEAVYTAALHADHPAMLAVRAAGIPLISRAGLLGRIAADYADSVGVAGTHGKSTTSGMISCICEKGAHSNSTYIVGAEMPFVGASYKVGTDSRFIFEACEYRDSFLSFHPKLAVVTNIKLDHTDYFPDENAIIASFKKYIAGSSSCLINADDANSVTAAYNCGKPIFTFSPSGGSADFSAVNIGESLRNPSFTVLENGVPTANIVLRVPGLHNISDALAAYGASRLIGISPDECVKGLAEFTGVKRRFEFCPDIHINGGFFYTDYAHHPDELDATLAAARAVTDGRIIAVFQPHTYSRLRSFFPRFAESLSAADKTIVTDVFAARETDNLGVSGKLLAEAIPGANYFQSFDDIAAYLRGFVRAGDTVLILGAGSIIGLVKLLEAK